MRRRMQSSRPRTNLGDGPESGPLPQIVSGQEAAAALSSIRDPATAARGLVEGCGRVFMPTGYEPGYAYPLLVWLPDPRRRSFDLGRTMARVSLRNYVAVEPVAGGSPADPEAAVWDAIDRVCDRMSVHPRRIFLVGQGRGGTQAFRIACRHATAFAGVVSISGAFPHGERLFGRLADVRRLPMLLCCRRDAPADVVRPTDATLRLFHAAGAMLAMRVYPGDRDLSSTILADVNRWIMGEVCGASSAEPAACGG